MALFAIFSLPLLAESTRRFARALLAAFAPLVGGSAPAPASHVQDARPPVQGTAAAAAVPTEPGPLVFSTGPGTPSVVLPRSERLVYKAIVSWGPAAATVGKVTQTCTVAEQEVPLMLARTEAQRGEAGAIKLQAEGEYLFYRMSSTLETRLLPQDWPRVYYQQSTDSRRGLRRREVMLGTKDGKPVSSYRGDTSKGAPAGQRMWRPARERAVPEGTLDMLTAIFMARTLVREGAESLQFPLIDTDRLWLLVLRRGEERTMETDAGTFHVVKVVLDPSPYPGEELEEKAKQFAGVFGIHGSIELWVEKRTGIPVRIQGDLPVDEGLITLGIDVVLETYSDTPPEFAPVAR